MRLVIKIISSGLFLWLITISCTKDGSKSADAPGTGTGGSLARFTIAANHLYLADYNSIEVYDLADAANPVKKTSVNVGGWGIETIYPYMDKLFIGSRDGMFIYSIADPSHPVKLGEARHVRSCDPVVANDSIAYVTLQGGSPCGPAQDGLYIYDIKNVTAPVQKSLFPISTPFGLGLKDSVVFVCRGGSGLSLVNVEKPSSPELMYTVADGNFKDVIPYDNLLICYVSTGLLIYDISDLKQIKKIGTVDY
ncbi:LVIVD repeat-containing protein [Terrimonas alba]|uniref:LVIVD repeat-containing protein n=1 Tax=Terrimonas alba TaxID=3349636 RepID=UPI0035F4A06E